VWGISSRDNSGEDDDALDFGYNYPNEGVELAAASQLTALAVATFATTLVYLM